MAASSRGTPERRSGRGTIDVFAYGSNLCVERMEVRVSAARVLTTAYLTGHALRFHKRGRDGSAKADAWPTGDRRDVVWGVVYQLSVADKIALDGIEGVGRGYLDHEVEVVTAAGEAMQVRTYRAQKSHVDATLAPFTWYRQMVARGATHHGFPAAYVAAIEAVTAVADPDRARHRRETVILRARGGCDGQD